MPISTVVLSTQREPLGNAIANVKRKIDGDVGNPLVFDGEKLIPSVTRVFSRSRDLYVFLQAYQRDVTVMRPLVAFVTFYRNDVKVMETTPLPVTDGWDAKSNAVPLRFSIPLEKLGTGKYDCQVTVLDPGGAKVAFWRAPIVILQ